MQRLSLVIVTVYFALSSGVPRKNLFKVKPTIGVIAQELSTGLNNISWIPAAYVKAVEASGARVVPIFINQTESYYRTVLDYVNGVVIPGGFSEFNVDGGFASAATYVYNIAKEINEKEGKIFPVLGVCQGLEIMSFIESGQINPLVPCKADNINLPLRFKVNTKRSKLYHSLSPQFLEILKTKPVTSNHHFYCLTEENFRKFNLSRNLTVLTTSRDIDGLKFVSSFESKRYPFVGLQFHPEKPAYEWSPKENNPHDYITIYLHRYFYDWLVNRARKNYHHFPNKETEYSQMIYNQPITYNPEAHDTEIYIFNGNKFTTNKMHRLLFSIDLINLIK